MAALPAPATLPAWRKPALVAAVGRRRRWASRWRCPAPSPTSRASCSAARPRSRCRSPRSPPAVAALGAVSWARRGVRAARTTDAAARRHDANGRPRGGRRSLASRPRAASVLQREVDLDLADVLLALGRATSSSISASLHRPVEHAAADSATTMLHVGHVALLVDLHARDDACPCRRRRGSPRAGYTGVVAARRTRRPAGPPASAAPAARRRLDDRRRRDHVRLGRRRRRRRRDHRRVVGVGDRDVRRRHVGLDCGACTFGGSMIFFGGGGGGGGGA